MNSFTRMTGWSAIAGGLLALGALATVLIGEATMGPDDFMGAPGAFAAGWASFIGAALFSVGLVGFAISHVPLLSHAGRRALGVLLFATAITTGAMATLALVVPHLAERMPTIVSEPPAAVPPTFIFSGLVSGICALVIAVGLRRRGLARGAGGVLLIAGAIVTMVPLPARFFLLAIAVGVLVLMRSRDEAQLFSAASSSSSEAASSAQAPQPAR